MPPKKAKAQSNASGGPTTALPASVVAGPGLEQQGRNSEHYVKVQEWRQVIMEHPLSSNSGQEMPLSMREHGLQEPFNEKLKGVMGMVQKKGANEEIGCTAVRPALLANARDTFAGRCYPRLG